MTKPSIIVGIRAYCGSLPRAVRGRIGRAPSWRWWTLLGICWSVGGLAAQDAPTPAQSVSAGSRIYGAKGCPSCHAINGIGGTEGPDLAQLSAHSLADLVAALWDHLPQMAARFEENGVRPPRLDPWEAADLMAFLFWVGSRSPAGDPEVGKALFASRRCIVCHQAGGVGGVLGPVLDRPGAWLSSIDLAAALWNHAPTMRAEMRARRIALPTLTGQEIDDLVAFLRAGGEAPPRETVHALGGEPERGRRMFRDRGCVRCHRVGGEGTAVGPNLTAVAPRDPVAFAAAMWNKAASMVDAMQAAGLPVPQFTGAEMADLVAYLGTMQYFADAGSAPRGRTTADAAGCTRCHGRSAPALKGQGTRSAVIAALWNHVGLAPDSLRRAWRRLTTTQAADLMAYLETQERGP